MTQGINRFVKYGSVGMSTFALDLALLFAFTDLFGWHYIFAAAAAFLIAVSINYFISRRFVFAGSDRRFADGYVIFLLITGIGLLGVTGLMALMVEVFEQHYLTSRILVACVVGVWNYLMNLYFNFRVAGKKE